MDAAVDTDAPHPEGWAATAWMAKWGFDHGVEGHQEMLDELFAFKVAQTAGLSQPIGVDCLSPWVSVQTLKKTLASRAKAGQSFAALELPQAKARVEAAELQEAIAPRGRPAQDGASSGAPGLGERKPVARL